MNDLILKTELIEWQKLKPFQPADLKNTTQARLDKLKNSLEKNGFAAPFNIWETGKKLFILDGHHRLKALEQMADEGRAVPEKLTCNFINIKNKKQAKKMVLAYNSHYAELSKDGVLDFVADLNLDDIKSEFEFFDLGFDLDEFESSFEEKINEKEIEAFELEKKCPKCGFEFDNKA